MTTTMDGRQAIGILQAHLVMANSDHQMDFFLSAPHNIKDSYNNVQGGNAC